MNGEQEHANFRLQEATIADIHAAFASGALSARRLVELYLSRIDAYDRNGPQINSIITLNPRAIEEAEHWDAVLAESGVSAPLHGIPIILKDQIDAQGMPTTLGSILLKDFFPDEDSFVTAKLRRAGAIILAKGTLGEMGGGDTHGSLFGSTKNPYDLDRTAGGSSGGPGASVNSNLGAAAIGQEGFASIRRPSAVEQHRGYEADRRTREPRRRLRRLAGDKRLSRPHDTARRKTPQSSWTRSSATTPKTRSPPWAWATRRTASRDSWTRQASGGPASASSRNQWARGLNRTPTTTGWSQRFSTRR